MLFARVVSTENGYSDDQKKAKLADPSRYYEVDYVSMGQSSTTVHIKEFGPMNSANLEFFKLRGTQYHKHDIYSDPDYNPYLALCR